MRNGDWCKVILICCALFFGLPQLRSFCINSARETSFRQYFKINSVDRAPVDATRRSIALCNVIIFLDPQDDDAYRARAMFESELGNYTAAVADYKKQLTIPNIKHEEEPMCWAGLGNALLKLGQKTDALSAFHRSAFVTFCRSGVNREYFELAQEDSAKEPTFANSQYRAAAVAESFGKPDVAATHWHEGDNLVLKSGYYDPAQIKNYIHVSRIPN